MGKNLAVAAIYEAYKTQLGITQKQNALLKENKLLREKFNEGEGDSRLLYKSTIEISKKEKQATEHLNNSIKKWQGITLPWGIKTHKQAETHQGSDIIFASEQDTYNIMQGMLPAKFNNTTTSGLPAFNDNPNSDLSTLINNSAVYWGTSKPTYVSEALIYINHELRTSLDLNSGIDYYNISNKFPPSIITVLFAPQNFNLADSIYSYNKGDTKGIAIVHSGYIFGGINRGGEINAIGAKAFDCASFPEYLLHKQIITSTADFMCIYNSQTSGFVPDGWLSSASGPAAGLYEATKIEKSDIGDIGFFRKYSPDQSPSNSIGVGGHVWIELGNGQRIEFNRDMPGIEGGRLVNNNLIFDNNKQLFYLTYTGENPSFASRSPFNNPSLNGIEYEYDGSNINAVVSWADSHINRDLPSFLAGGNSDSSDY